jgi:hypothetical protein
MAVTPPPADRPTCEISWIDEDGITTPDSNPSIGRIRTRDRWVQISGAAIHHFSASRWFHICAEHAQRMDEDGMDIWEWETENTTIN